MGWAAPAVAHGSEPRYVAPLEWEARHVRRVYALGRGLGLRGKGEGAVVEVAGRRCVRGAVLAFDVDDAFAFDVDETVTLTLEVEARGTPRLVVGYDANGSAEDRQVLEVTADAESPWGRVEVPLERARFAGRGPLGTDLALSGAGVRAKVTVCGLRLERSFETPAPRPAGRLSLRLTDAATGRPTAARLGLYDAAGRTPLPSEEAVLLPFFTDRVRQVAVRPWAFWPHPNHWVFYADGAYAAEVPAGTYTVVAMKGLEHRVARRQVMVRPGETTRVELRLRRWVDLPSEGWYSGDVHLHLERGAEDAAILAQVEAEDLYVANLLQMGNIHGTYFRHPAWGEAGQVRRGERALVPGQEDPRTGHRGHTISLNLQGPVRRPERYFLYHEVFEEVHRQGGLSGYAHLPYGWFQVLRGLALDVPFGVVDFLEVLQVGSCETAAWYDFLNLGFKLAPAAGSDHPYLDLPGTVRLYARVAGDFSPQGWFDALAAGRVFVTSGPLLELDVNGRGAGGELDLARSPGGDESGGGEAGGSLRIRARATINPDLPPLERLELVVHGEVVESVEAGAEGARELVLRHALTPEAGLWLAVRALGVAGEDEEATVAHSAPVYVSVDGSSHWQPGAVPEIVRAQRQRLEELLTQPLEPGEDLEWWETAELLQRLWVEQKPLLARRAAEAHALYDELLTRLRRRGEPLQP